MRPAQPPPWHYAVACSAGHYDETASSGGCPYPARVPYAHAELSSNDRVSYAPSPGSGQGRAQGGADLAQHNSNHVLRIPRPQAEGQEQWRSVAAKQPRLMQSVQLIVKNTFIDGVRNNEARQEGMTRSASDSDISASSGGSSGASSGASSGEELRFWLPSVTSSSSNAEPSKASAALDFASVAHSPPSGVRGCMNVRGDATLPDDASGPGYSARDEVSLALDLSEPPLPEIPMELPNGISVEAVRGHGLGSLGRNPSDAVEPQSVASAACQEQHIPTIVRQVHEETGLPIAELLELHAAHDLSRVPRHGSTGVLLSVGTIQHQEGWCSPCMFHSKKMCFKGVTCSFCHARHRGAQVTRIRPSKKRREQMAAAAKRAETPANAESSSDEEGDVQATSSSQTASAGAVHVASQRTDRIRPAEWPSRITLNDMPRAKMRL